MTRALLILPRVHPHPSNQDKEELKFLILSVHLNNGHPKESLSSPERLQSPKW